MRRLAAPFLALAIVFGTQVPALGQVCVALQCPPPDINRLPPQPPPTRATIPPLGIYALTSVGCAAASPILGTAILGRALTMSEVYHTTLGCFLGPAGWLRADVLMTLPGANPPEPPAPPPPHLTQQTNPP